MKKLLMVSIVLGLMTVSNTAFAQDYSGHQNETAIQYLYDNEIVEGYADGTFKPENNLLRAELMKILVLGAGFDPSAEEYKNCFPDVNEEWFARYICFAKEKGYVEGYPDGTFKPENNVIKVEAIKMLMEAFNVKLEYSTKNSYEDTFINEWYGPYIFNAKKLGLLEEEGSFYYPSEKIKRGQVSENIYRLIMNEKERFNVAGEATLCEAFYFGDYDIVTTPLEEVDPILTEKLKENSFDVIDDSTLNVIKSRNSYTANEFLANPSKVCGE